MPLADALTTYCGSPQAEQIRAIDPKMYHAARVRSDAGDVVWAVTAQLGSQRAGGGVGRYVSATLLGTRENPRLGIFDVSGDEEFCAEADIPHGDAVGPMTASLRAAITAIFFEHLRRQDDEFDAAIDAGTAVEQLAVMADRIARPVCGGVEHWLTDDEADTTPDRSRRPRWGAGRRRATGRARSGVDPGQARHMAIALARMLATVLTISALPLIVVDDPASAKVDPMTLTENVTTIDGQPAWLWRWSSWQRAKVSLRDLPGSTRYRLREMRGRLDVPARRAAERRIRLALHEANIVVDDSEFRGMFGDSIRRMVGHSDLGRIREPETILRAERLRDGSPIVFIEPAHSDDTRRQVAFAHSGMVLEWGALNRPGEVERQRQFLVREAHSFGGFGAKIIRDNFDELRAYERACRARRGEHGESGHRSADRVERRTGARRRGAGRPRGRRVVRTASRGGDSGDSGPPGEPPGRPSSERSARLAPDAAASREKRPS